MSSIYYLHGFGSRFDTASRKIITLAKLGPVRGHNIDYMQPAEEVIEDSLDKLMQVNPDLIVGTSMGGWLAGVLGAETGIPFVAINPVVDPSRTLKLLIGEGEDLQGNLCELTAATVASYYPFVQSGDGIILLDQGDEFIQCRETLEALDGYYPVHTFPGGSHRFEHMEESLALIREHIAQ